MTRSARYNPFDFIRGDDSGAARDISVLLDAFLTPPLSDTHGSARHFYESARAIIGGYIAWVRFGEPSEKRNLARLHELLLMPVPEQDSFATKVKDSPRRAGGLAHAAVERQARAGKEESGSNFSTIANQLAFMNFPEMSSHTARSDFDPLMIADGNTDLFVVVPDELIDHVKGWLRLWVALPYAVAGRRPLNRNLLIVIDEMPRLGFLKPVMDGYNLAAGKGVNFWCFAQSLSALESTWGKAHRKTLTDQAEVLQILGFPRTDTAGAEDLSRAIGMATYRARSESLSGTLSENRVLPSTLQRQASESHSLVGGRVVPPDSLMALGPDRQFVISGSKALPRDTLSLFHARYWKRTDACRLADPNPLVLRKQGASRR